MFTMDMKDEKQQKELFPEGLGIVVVLDIEAKKSKAGNDMFVCKIKHCETGAIDTFWLVTTKGKRWLLKTLLDAIGVTKDENGNHCFEFADLIEKKVLAEVYHEETDFKTEDGKTIKTKNNRIRKFEPYIPEDDDEEVPF